MVLTIDVGKAGCGVSLYYPLGDLLRSFFVVIDPSDPEAVARDPSSWADMANAVCIKTTDVLGSDARVSVAVIETMMIYKHSPGRPDDVLNLQGLAGAVAGTLRTTFNSRLVHYLARDWKGQVPREVMGERIAAVVLKKGWSDRVERTRMGVLRGQLTTKNLTKTELNDVHHSVGLGLYHFKKASD